MTLQQCSATVFRCPEHPLLLDATAIETLRAAAQRSPLRRARVCMHATEEAPVHEMLIVLLNGVYIRPHKHTGKSESFHLIAGSVGVVFFDDAGQVTRKCRLSREQAGCPYYYRINEGVFHTQVVLSDYAVFHECTRGPFLPDQTIPAPWSPPESAPETSSAVAALVASFVDVQEPE